MVSGQLCRCVGPLRTSEEWILVSGQSAWVGIYRLASTGQTSQVAPHPAERNLLGKQ